MKHSFTLLALSAVSFGLVGCSVGNQQTVTYSFKVSAVGEGGKKGVAINLVDEKGKTVASGTTARGGTVDIEAAKGTYKIVASDLPAGYYQTAELSTSEELEYSLELNTKIITGAEPERGTKLYKGDVCYDYEFTMTDGTKCSISSLLETKEAVLINFWGTECGVCLVEMPHLNSYYEEMKNSKVGFICVNSYNISTADEINEFMAANEYTLPSTTYDNKFDKWLGISGWPTNVIIDRNGRYAGGEAGFSGDGNKDTFHNMVDKYLGDSYVPKY